MNYNTASTISWTSQNISGPITITNLGSFNNASGSRSTGNLNGGASGGTRTFTATANTLYSPPATVTSNTVTVNINPPPEPTVTLTASPSSSVGSPLDYDSNVRLSWTSTNATEVEVTNFGASTSDGVSSGYKDVNNITSSTQYTIIVKGPTGRRKEATTIVYIKEEPPIEIHITSNKTNVNTSDVFGVVDWTRNVRKKLYIDPGVVVGSTNHNLAALIISSGVVGAFTLINGVDGDPHPSSIQGAPGAAGSANGGNGGKGGNAIRADAPGSGGSITIENYGSIVAGGGGGGAGTKGGTGGKGGDGSVAGSSGSTCEPNAGCQLTYNLGGGIVSGCCAIAFNVVGATNYYNNPATTTTGGDGGPGGNGGNGGVGQGYNVTNTGGVNTGLGSPTDWVGKTGGTNAGTGGQGGSGGSGGGGGGFGTNGDPGNQGDTGDPGTSGNVTGGSGGIAGDLPVGQGGVSGYSLNGTNYTSLNGYVVGPTKSNP